MRGDEGKFVGAIAKICGGGDRPNLAQAGSVMWRSCQRRWTWRNHEKNHFIKDWAAVILPII
jgi:hypothetical protein